MFNKNNVDQNSNEDDGDDDQLIKVTRYEFLSGSSQ